MGLTPQPQGPFWLTTGYHRAEFLLHGNGFIVRAAEAEVLGLGRRDGLERHIRPYRNGRDLLQISRNAMVVDFFGLSEEDVRQRFPEAYQHLWRTVRIARKKVVEDAIEEHGRATKDAEAYLQLWWIFGKPRPDLRAALQNVSRYIATVETSKHRVFEFLDVSVLPDNKLVAIGTQDPFVLGVLSSRVHRSWYLANAGMIGVYNEKAVYVKTACFDPFPFPDAALENRERIGALAEELDSTRKQALAEVPRLTMTEIYNWRERIAAGEQLAGNDLDRATAARAFIVHRLHEQIDGAVAGAYGWPTDLAPAEIVARLVALNHERAAEEKAGKVRWLRPDYQDPRFARQ